MTLMNNSRKTRFSMAIVASVVLVLFLAAPSSELATDFREANAQNATNQTAGPSANATGLGNVTGVDFETLEEELDSARLGLQNNDTFEVYSSLSIADTELFEIITSEGSSGSVAQQLKPVRDQIQKTQDTMLTQDSAKTLEDLNQIDVELLKITERLPAGEE